jgi:hypothetical protein
MLARVKQQMQRRYIKLRSTFDERLEEEPSAFERKLRAFRPDPQGAAG